MDFVIRRVGGLEASLRRRASVLWVIRRVGGLEDEIAQRYVLYRVIRRVGGLEVMTSVTHDDTLLSAA